MKIVQVVPKAKLNGKLKTLLKQTELGLRGTNTTLYRYSEGQWRHKKFRGKIKWDGGIGGIILAEVSSNDDEFERKLLESFIGYLNRHLGKHVENISITYR